MIQRLQNPKAVENLFDGWDETCISSALDGLMGEVYAESENSESAMVILGDFCFLGGRPDEALVSFRPSDKARSEIIMVPQNEKWGALIEKVFGKRAVKVTRYAIKKEKGIFDSDKLEAIIDSLPDGFEIQRIDEKLYYECLKYDWSRDFVSNFKDYDEFAHHGLGFVIMKNGKMAAGASSYSYYRDGIEVEIVTEESFRHMGLASVVGAKLVSECVKRGLYPSWDARIPWSVRLAEKFGYSFDHEYRAYEVNYGEEK